MDLYFHIDLQIPRFARDDGVPGVRLVSAPSVSVFSYSRRSHSAEAFRHRIPVDRVPPRRHVIRTTILVLQVVRMLPDIESEDRVLSVHQRRILVRRAGDRELAAVVDEPRPA